MRRFRTYSTLSLLLVLALLSGVTAVIVARESEQQPDLSQDWSSVQTCSRIVRCDTAAVESPNFLKDCIGFFDRSSARFPVQAKAMRRCARNAQCEEMDFAGCVMLFYRGIKFDRASVLPLPRMPKPDHLPIRELKDWPAPIAGPDAKQQSQMRRICELRRECSAADLKTTSIPRSPEYCVESMISVFRFDQIQYQNLADCLELYPCSSAELSQCAMERAKQAEAAAKQTPEYKAAELEVRPFCERVRKCYQTDGESTTNIQDLCTDFLIEFRKSPGHFRTMSTCLKEQPCDSSLFSSCLKRTITTYRE